VTRPRAQSEATQPSSHFQEIDVTLLRPLVLALCASFLLLVPSRASAAPGKASAAVEASNRRLRESLRKFYRSTGKHREQARRQAREAVSALLDFDAFAKETLGKHWASLTPAERARYTEAMKGAMEANYLAKMGADSFDIERVKVEILGEEKQGDRMLVKTKVHHGADTVEVDYVMVDTKKGPRAIDVITEGVSLVETYRDQINTLLPKKGLNGVVEAFDRVRKRAEKQQNEQADRQTGASADAAPAAPQSK
jgi:ABC-type transporter MlaC component